MDATTEATDQIGTADPVDVVVIGAGQAGLSAAYHLQDRGFVPVGRATESDRSFVTLDSEVAPGGAWRHRWETLTMDTVNGIYELPDYPVPALDPTASSRDALPEYFANYEAHFDLDVLRPVQVKTVHRIPIASTVPTSSQAVSSQAASIQAASSQAATSQAVSTDGDYEFLVATNRGSWRAGYVINATGTWSRPFWPHYPGRETFEGQQLHVHDYESAQEFIGKRVVIVGAGISATQLLDEISAVTDTLWVTRRAPVWEQGAPSSQELAAAVARVEERTRQGLAPQSVISVTGMYRTPWIERIDERGALVRHPMFTHIEPTGVRMPDGRFEPADVILWATGFRPAVRHLAPLRLQTAQGGYRVANGRSLDEPRLFLIGYGPSQSTVGANRAGRDAVFAILKDMP